MTECNDKMGWSTWLPCRLHGATSLVEMRRPDVFPPFGTIFKIWNQPLRLVGIAKDRLVIAHASSPFGLFLVPDLDGTPGLMTVSYFTELSRSGQVEVEKPSNARPQKATDPVRLAAERLRTECDMLDAAGVRNGSKSIDMFIHANWTADLRSRYGEPDNCHTIRRWRSKRKRELT